MDAACPLIIDASRRHPIHRLDPHRFVVHGGRHVVIIDACDSSAQLLLTTGNSLGAIAVSDDGAWIALGEQCRESLPRIVIFAADGEEKIREITALENGAQQRYDALDFSRDGGILASVSGHPDFMLTLWNWKNGDVILRSKAFSQEIFTVKFSRFFDRQLITSGTGHIRFWTLADTFTGMKLQGALGKFGKVELADIPAFAELKDGYVLAGTDDGELLLWKECLIQAVIRSPENRKCHEDSVNFVKFDSDDSNQVITASSDGCIKFWAAEDLLRFPDAEDGSVPFLEVLPRRILCLKDQYGSEEGKSYQIESFIEQDDAWIVFLRSGGLLSLASPMRNPDKSILRMETIWDFPSGKIGGLVVFGKGSSVAVAAGDGTLWLFDIEERRLLYKSIRFSAGATCMTRMPLSLDPEGRHCVVGFEDGTVRVLKRCLDGWKLVCALRPHKAPVVAIHTWHEAAATICRDGGIFFFSVSNCVLLPIGKITLPACEAKGTSPIEEVTAGCLAKRRKELYLGTNRGRLFKAVVPSLSHSQQSRSDETYFIDCSMTEVDLGLSSRERTEVLSLETMSSDDSDPYLIVSIAGPTSSSVLVLSLAEDTSTLVLSDGSSSAVTCIMACLQSNRLILGAEDGSVRIGQLHVTNNEREPRWVEEKRRNLHDSETGSVVGVGLSNDNRHVNVEVVEKSVMKQPWNESLPLKSQDPSPQVEDIVGRETHSIDEARSKETQKVAEEYAQQKKNRIRRYIEDLRDQLYALKKENAQRPIKERLPEDVFEVDDKLREKMESALERRVAEGKRTYAYELEKHILGLRKLHNRFFEGIVSYPETLSGFESQFVVTSYFVAKKDASTDRRRQLLQGEVHDLRNKREDVDLVRSSRNGSSQEAFQKEGLAVSENTSMEPNSRKMREERITKHEQSKPNDDQENEEDAEAIQRAKDTIGDFKLKTDHDYTPPQEGRKHPSITEYELLSLEEEIRTAKERFNAKFRALKKVRKSLLAEIRSCAAYLERRRNTAASEVQSLNLSLESAISEDDGMQKLSDQTNDLLREANAFLISTQIQTKEESIFKADPSNNVLSNPEQEKVSCLEAELENQRILRRCESAIQDFDECFCKLALEKLELDCDLKHAEIVKAVKRRELLCLQGFQEKEDEIEDRLSAHLREQRRLKALVEECERRADEKTKLDTFPKSKNALLMKFDRMVPDGHAHRDHFMKLFMARTETRESDPTTSCSDSSDSDHESSDEEVDDSAIVAVDKELATSVSLLREERLAMEAKHAQQMKEIDSVRKERDQHLKKLKIIESSVSASQTEMRRCQKEKQTELNEIRSAVVLRPSQIETPSVSGATCHPSVIAMDPKQLLALEERPKELQEETVALRRSYQSLKRHYLQLARDKRAKTQNLDDLERRLEEMQMLRFGQVIDLDELDLARENQTASTCRTAVSDELFQIVGGAAMHRDEKDGRRDSGNREGVIVGDKKKHGLAGEDKRRDIEGSGNREGEAQAASSDGVGGHDRRGERAYKGPLS